MKKYKLSSLLPLSYILLLVLVSPLYDVLNKSDTPAVDVTTIVDNWIPFVKVFIIPYLLWFPYLYGALIYYCFADRKQYYVTLSSVILGKLTCFSIYYMWQTTVPRPEVVGTDVFSNLVRYIYSIDQPVNCFPSIHVLTTFVIMLAAYKRREQHRWEYWILTFFGSLIILSTLLTKQHAFLDAVSGIAVASTLYFGVQLILANRQETVTIPAGQQYKM
ncbi:phosphatase PAP2 family protein [Bacillus sp. DX1.1]|uniref:phosphatase PAP2 family protein n=1 Tax=unclassified Bacillus (in: firmicutes) TaxID=185979 RepID=UPI002570960B|nr:MULTISPECIES: phosphatase PAP2 family protein [unclassified Bacillus (in: firmicutes)]MDM5157120.1 phosphatase PAP2 family protein [Bacillus sp. DX1.1]WJE81355.1 phosphatase PAP2 family protein [Bacillus sp. DX3.1]